jgi:hypothetical protein
MNFIRNILQLLLDKYIYLVYKKRIIIGNRPYQWCSVPVPQSCPKQSQTHPSILFFKQKWNGENLWLATTPYPNARVEYENPCVYYADHQSFTKFTPVENNPILPYPGGTKFNSDVELYFENNTLFAVSREYDGGNLSKKMLLQSSGDGHTWSVPHVLFETADATLELLSPSVLQYKNNIRFYCLNGNAGVLKKGVCTGIDVLEGKSLNDSDFKIVDRGAFLNKNDIGIEPWHCDVFEYKKMLYMVLCARNVRKKTIRAPMETYLAVSDNYLDFFIFPQPIVKHIKTYRPTAFVDNNDFYLYFSAVGRYLNDGSDRAIGLAIFDMKELLQEVRL